MHQIQQLIRLLEQVLPQLEAFNQKVGPLMALLDQLTAAVTNDASVEQSAITLLNGLAAQLAAAQGDPAAVAALAAQLTAQSSALAAAVSANTPAAPPAPAPVATPAPADPTPVATATP